MAVGLGSNRGDRVAHLAAGRRALEARLEGARWSRVYETVPVGRADQPAFLNLCCVGRTAAGPRDLLAFLLETERREGRGGGDRAGPRPLDLDLLLYGDRRVSGSGLEVPHPRMAERAFVLAPLSELIPEVEVPDAGATVAELSERVGRAGVEPVGFLEDLAREEVEDG